MKKFIIFICLALLFLAGCKSHNADQTENETESENVLRDYIKNPQHRAHGVSDISDQRNRQMFEQLND